MTIYLSSFYPLVCTNAGKNATRQFDLPPFIDGSCRREPDFEKDFPAITGLCRPGFAKKLEIDDIVIYTTNKYGIGLRKIVAVLKVINNSCENHQQAANWYKGNNYAVPNNIMVKQTKPFKLNQTHQKHDRFSCGSKIIEEWNGGYEKRAIDYPQVAICELLFKELYNPIELTEEDMMRIFKRRPGTRNPAIVEEPEWNEIKKILGIK